MINLVTMYTVHCDRCLDSLDDDEEATFYFDTEEKLLAYAVKCGWQLTDKHLCGTCACGDKGHAFPDDDWIPWMVRRNGKEVLTHLRECSTTGCGAYELDGKVHRR